VNLSTVVILSLFPTPPDSVLFPVLKGPRSDSSEGSVEECWAFPENDTSGGDALILGRAVLSPTGEDRNPVQLLKQHSRGDLPPFPALNHDGVAVRVSLLRLYGRAYAD
jgi:hypothetical protein